MTLTLRFLLVLLIGTSIFIAVPFLVSWQEGSIVSRTIIDKNVGTVTVFAFDEDQKLSTHSAPFDALVQIVEGTGIIRIEDEVFEIDAPGVIIMPANKPHSVAGKGRFKMVLTMIRVKE